MNVGTQGSGLAAIGQRFQGLERLRTKHQYDKTSRKMYRYFVKCSNL
jgi:hypothetical protein